MSAFKTITLSRTGDGELVFTPASTKWNPAGYPANAQIAVSGMEGGVFALEFLPAGDSAYRVAFPEVTEADLAVIAGKDAPLFEALRVTVSGSSGGVVTATLTLWERGI